jgi:hypothetical protein
VERFYFLTAITGFNKHNTGKTGVVVVMIKEAE